MAATSPSTFTWGMGGQKITTPEQARRQREIAAALIARSATPAANIGQGLADVASALSGTVLTNRAQEAETLGAEEVGGLFQGLSSASPEQDIIAALSNPWASDSQSGVARALLGAQMAETGPENPYLNVGGGSIFNTATGEFMSAPGAGDDGLTDTQRNLEWRATQAGLVPGTPEYQQFMVSGGQGGTSLTVDPSTGAVSFTQGAGKPLTEIQSKDNVFATRAQGALPVIDELENSLLSLPEATLGEVPVVGNFVKSEEYQMAQNAGREFLASILRKDSGAAITPSEEQVYGDIYLPRPGDKPKTIVQKRKARARALDAIKSGMRPDQVLALEKREGGPDAPGGNPNAVVVDGFSIEAID